MGDISNIDVGWRSALMFAVCLPLLVAAGMLAFRAVERPANRFLAAFLFVAAVAQVPQIIGFSGFYTVWPGLTFAPFNVELYAGPLLYLHADRLMMARPLGRRRWLLLPGALQTAYYLWAFLYFPDYRAKWEYSDSFHVPYIEPVETALGLALMLTAIVLIVGMVKRYHVFLANTQSAARDFEPRWLHRLVAAVVLAGVVFAFLEFVPVFVTPLSYVDEFPAQVLLTAIVAWLGFQAIAQTGTPFPKMPMEEEVTPPVDADKDWSAEAERLQAALVDGEWYLEPRLSIRDVANRLQSNETYVSRTLNQGLGVNFNRYINAFRVRRAQDLLKDGEHSLLAIAEMAGFNSKATFNRVFREHTGITPSAFKASQNP